ncbi:MAG: PaaI family thioesterase [Prevotellaceae bacterium]|jgi:acyl-CoA thioesterase|nr:PaaI family thioesterase [Prevotellaceae bacterium]
MENTLQLIQKDHFANHNQMRVIEVGEGTAKTQMTVTGNHLNGLGTVQGGALFTLADLAFAAASNSREKIAVALDASINFIKAVSSGTLTATAREIDLKRTIGIYCVEIRNEADELIATFQSTAYRKEPKL